MNKRILVIAGGGFLGKRLLRQLLTISPKALVCADLVDPGMQGVRFFKLDLLQVDDEEMAELVIKFDIVINCSGQITNPINTCLRLNSEGMRKICEAVKAAGNFMVHFSTVTVYGSCAEASETTPLNPETAYSTAKFFAEFMIRDLIPSEQYCILRLSNLYGEDQPKGIFSYIGRSYNSDRKLEFNNNGEMIRYYLHVDDCAAIAVQMIAAENIAGTYNLIGPDQLTIKELVSLAEEVAGVKFDVSYTPVVSWDNTGIIIDNSIKEKNHFTYTRSVETAFTQIFNSK